MRSAMAYLRTNRLYLLLLISLFLVPRVDHASSLDSRPGDWPLRNVACHAQITRYLNQWGRSRDWRKNLMGLGDYAFFLSPTHTIGRWLELKLFENGNVETRVSTVKTQVVADWNMSSCRPGKVTRTVARHLAFAPNGFTDQLLRKLVKQHRRGLIYIWTPYMPFSTSAVNGIRLASQRLHIPVFFALDPHADEEQARLVAKGHHFDASFLRPVQSLELLNRDILNHFPSVVMFENGRMLPWIIPGSKTGDIYTELVSHFMKRGLE